MIGSFVLLQRAGNAAQDQRNQLVLDPIENLFSLEHVISHHVEAIDSNVPLVVETSPEQWAYAVSFPRQPISTEHTEPILVCVTGWVERGVVGVGAVGKDHNTFLTEYQRTPQHGRTTFEFLLESTSKCDFIVLRNWAAGGRSSKATIESITAYRCVALPEEIPFVDQYKISAQNIDNVYNAPRIDFSGLILTFQRAKNLYSDKTILVITDLSQQISDAPSLVYYPGVEIRELLGATDMERTIFIPAFHSDENAVKVLAYIKAAGGSFFSCQQSLPVASYFHLNNLARRVLANEFRDQHYERFAKWDGPDFTNIIQAIDITRDIDGDYVEVGVFEGSSARLALRYMREAKVGRRSFFIDTFEGFQYDEAKSSIDRIWDGTHALDNQELVKKRLNQYSDLQNGLDVIVLKCNILRDFPKDIRKIALANIDVDMYEATKAALHRIAPLVVSNGIIIVEDAGRTPLLSGARLALSEFLESDEGGKFISVYMESGQTFLIRK